MGADAFKAARDFLLANRADYRKTHDEFRWPEREGFNYALDWFDAELAQGGNAGRLALKIAGDGGGTATYGELSERSNRIGNGLRALGVKRGKRILLMLGNVVPLLDAITENKATTICAPSTVWRMFVQEDMTGWSTSLRDVCSAGEPRNPEIIGHVQDVRGLTVRESYGQTETTVQIAYFAGRMVKPGSMGQEPPGYRIRLLDPGEQDAAEGEVCIDLNPQPVRLKRGYQNDDGSFAPLGKTAYRTGDVATCDADGYYTCVGRADDVFKASGYQISPFELESALIEHPAVAEAAVVPAPDPIRMAVPKAYITLTASSPPDRATALSIFQHVRTTLAPFRRVRPWSSPISPRRFPAKSAVWSCGGRKRRVPRKAGGTQRNSGKRIFLSCAQDSL